MLSGRRMCVHVGGGFGTTRGPKSSDSCMCACDVEKGDDCVGGKMLATCKFPPSSRSGRCAANHEIEFSSENGNEGRKGKFHRRRFSRFDNEKFYFHVFLGRKSFHFGPIAEWINGSKKKKQKKFPVFDFFHSRSPPAVGCSSRWTLIATFSVYFIDNIARLSTENRPRKEVQMQLDRAGEA